jgi:hypothetical protein
MQVLGTLSTLASTLIRDKKCLIPNGSKSMFASNVFRGLVEVKNVVKWVENMLFDGVF